MITEIYSSIQDIPADSWNNLLDPSSSSPFIRHEYLLAMEVSDSACTKTGWTPCHFTVWEENPKRLVAAMPCYIKTHSYGEYVFDWAWANAYQQNGLDYYPKLLCAIPFTPVGGTRILGNQLEAKKRLLTHVQQFAKENDFSSIHLLFPPEEDEALLKEFSYLRRESVQFHWKNQSLEDSLKKLENFDEFLYTLNKKRRNNILRERASIQNASINFRHVSGELMGPEDWETFYECYATNYYNHGNAPYLNLHFFLHIGQYMPQFLHIILAQRDDKTIGASLLFRNRAPEERAYGRYWGSTEYIPNLHFETAYYQTIEFCIKEKISVFEGGAQGEHKIHRGLLPVNLYSMHYLLDNRFYDAVENFLQREGNSMHRYINELVEHQPIKTKTA